MDRKADILYGVVCFLLSMIAFFGVLKLAAVESFWVGILIYIGFKVAEFFGSCASFLFFPPAEESKE